MAAKERRDARMPTKTKGAYSARGDIPAAEKAMISLSVLRPAEVMRAPDSAEKGKAMATTEGKE